MKDFYIQAGNPYVLDTYDKNDSTLSDILESIFPMYTEDMILFWNYIGIPLSYKYDVSYMIDDVLNLLSLIQITSKGEKKIHWLPDTFRVDWLISWDELDICIKSKWEKVVGNLETILSKKPDIKLPKKEFVSEWKKVIEVLMESLGKSRYIMNDDVYIRLLAQFNTIDSYGVLYQN